MVRAPDASSPQNAQNTQIPKTKKEKSREKEFRRAQSINGAFESLQQHIPYLKPEERRSLPKIKTLRLAMQYIKHLTQLLDGNQMHQTDCDEIRPLVHADFRMAVSSEMRIRNSYRERAHTQEMDPNTVRRILAREEQRGRRIHMDVIENSGVPQPFSANTVNYMEIGKNDGSQQVSPSSQDNQYYFMPQDCQYHFFNVNFNYNFPNQ